MRMDGHHHPKTDHKRNHRSSSVGYKWQGYSYYRQNSRHHAYIHKDVKHKSEGETAAQNSFKIIFGI